MIQNTYLYVKHSEKSCQKDTVSFFKPTVSQTQDDTDHGIFFIS